MEYIPADGITSVRVTKCSDLLRSTLDIDVHVISTKDPYHDTHALYRRRERELTYDTHLKWTRQLHTSTTDSVKGFSYHTPEKIAQLKHFLGAK